MSILIIRPLELKVLLCEFFCRCGNGRKERCGDGTIKERWTSPCFTSCCRHKKWYRYNPIYPLHGMPQAQTVPTPRPVNGRVHVSYCFTSVRAPFAIDLCNILLKVTWQDPHPSASSPPSLAALPSLMLMVSLFCQETANIWLDSPVVRALPHNREVAG